MSVCRDGCEPKVGVFIYLGQEKSDVTIQTFSPTCNDPYTEVDVDDAGGEGGQDHSQRGKEATHHHHWATAKAVHQHTAQRTWIKCDTLSQAVCVCVVQFFYECEIQRVNKTALESLEAGVMKLIWIFSSDWVKQASIFPKNSYCSFQQPILTFP